MGAKKKKTQQYNESNKKSPARMVEMGIIGFQLTKEVGENSHGGWAKSGSHENSVRSGTERLRKRVVGRGDEGRIKLESHCSGCDYGGEL